MSDLGGGGVGGGAGAGAARAEGQYAVARTSVWWDIENCAVPRNCDPHLIALNIGSALENLGYGGRVSISAYGDTNKIPDSVQRALNSTGVSLNHIPAGVKDASDKKILVDMLFWAVDNPPPSNYLLISGDRDFSNALHQLGLRKYNVLLAQPQSVSSALVAAAKSVWEWPSLVAGGPPMSQLPEACKSNISDSVKASQPSVFEFSGNQNGNGNGSGSGSGSGSGNGRSANNGNGNGNGRAANNRYKAKVKNPNQPTSISRVPSYEFRSPVPGSQESNPNQPTSISRVPSYEFRPPVPGSQESLTSGTSDKTFTTMKPSIQQTNHSVIQGESISHPQSAAYKPTSSEGLDAKQFNDTGHHAFIPIMPSGPSYSPTRSDYSGNTGKSPIENGNTASNNQLRPRDLFPQNGNLTKLNSLPLSRPSDFTQSRPSGPLPPNSRPVGAPTTHNRPVSPAFPPYTRPLSQPINLQHARSAPPFPAYPPANLAPYPPANLPNFNYPNNSGYPNGSHHNAGYPNGVHHNAPSYHQGPVRPVDLHYPQHFGPGIFPRPPHPTGIDNNMPLMGVAFPPDVLDIIGNVLSTLKNEKIAPTEANIGDCIFFGEMNIRYFDVRAALNYALKSQFLAEHKLGKRPPYYYTKKREPLWKCVQECSDKKYPKETWDSIQNFLSSAEGQLAMQSSQCRYQAAIRLKKGCLKSLVLGDVLQLLNAIINCKKWILPHATGWQPLSVTCPSTNSSDASTSL